MEEWGIKHGTRFKTLPGSETIEQSYEAGNFV